MSKPEFPISRNHNLPFKAFVFPESYNLLRQELYLHWPELWRNVQWQMAFDAEWFIELMNKATDNAYNVLQITSSKEQEIDYICSVFLKHLRKKRGEANP